MAKALTVDNCDCLTLRPKSVADRTIPPRNQPGIAGPGRRFQRRGASIAGSSHASSAAPAATQLPGSAPEHEQQTGQRRPDAGHRRRSDAKKRRASGSEATRRRSDAAAARSAGLGRTGRPMSPKGLPTLNITGYINDQDGTRLVIVNDRLLREGEEVSPGLRVEKIIDDGCDIQLQGTTLSALRADPGPRRRRTQTNGNKKGSRKAAGFLSRPENRSA